MNDFSLFGRMIRIERERKNLPLWKFAALIPFPQSNVTRIELGLTEPRVGTVMRMLNALDIPIGEFMRKLALEVGICNDIASDPDVSVGSMPDMPILEFVPNILSNANTSYATIFGLLLKTARLTRNKTQCQVAEAAGYSTRSVILVEKGRQEPGLVSALKLVVGVGWNMEEFFGAYERLMRTVP